MNELLDHFPTIGIDQPKTAGTFAFGSKQWAGRVYRRRVCFEKAEMGRHVLLSSIGIGVVTVLEKHDIFHSLALQKKGNTILVLQNYNLNTQKF